MARAHEGSAGESRASALWGSGNRGGEHRSSALWGTGTKGGGDGRSRHGLSALIVTALALALPLSAAAGSSGGSASYVAPGVYQAAQQNSKVRVIVQSADGVAAAKQALALLGTVKAEFSRLGMVAAEIPSLNVGQLAALPGLVVTLDAKMKADGSYSSNQLWPHENGVAKLWGTPGAPAIAIVDSGIEKSLPSFGDGSRVVQRQAFGQSGGGGLDSRGHGTFVAAIAAGEAAGYAGASPGSNLVDLDVMNENGMALTSDVIAACEWILQHKDAYNIRVANFSLHSSSVVSIRYHPLNRAVEKLWFSGVVVVASAGNYGNGTGPSGVVHAPGNDPFVITVGALDINGSARINDDGVASWSAYGYTYEGFAKPDLVAAGRYMVSAVPDGSNLAVERSERMVAPGYIQLSGTSFSTPVVSGIVAQLLARNPGYTPDQVKGVLMKTARRVPEASLLAQGRGQVNAVRGSSAAPAAAINAALNPFVVTDPNGGLVFDAAGWSDAAWSDAGWDSAAWSDAGWSDAAWSDAGWSDAAWSDAGWSDAAWSDAAWSDSSAYEDHAETDPTSGDVALMSEDEVDIANDPELALPAQ